MDGRCVRKRFIFSLMRFPARALTNMHFLATQQIVSIVARTMESASQPFVIACLALLVLTAPNLNVQIIVLDAGTAMQ
jgi:hypothetical protein